MGTQNPSVLLLDFDLPDLGEVAGVAALQKLSPTTRILVATRAFDADEELSLLRIGAMGCFRKDIDPALLNRVVTVVRDGGLWITRSLIPGLIEEIRDRHGDRVKEAPARKNLHLHLLTRREQEVATLVGSGASNKQIARLLNISDRTVKAHLTTTFQKLGITDRLRLALYMSANGASEQESGG
jgi:DNA-binding NarL/FixJ family response regulator